MWCDDFDMDLYKVVPEAEAILEPVKDMKLYTHGHETGGKLNHPTVWNSHHGLVAFFGFEAPYKLEAYWTRDPVIECTFEEAVRDCWPHHYIMLIEGHKVWDMVSSDMVESFNAIMYHVRGWQPLDKTVLAEHKTRVLLSLKGTVAYVSALRDRTAGGAVEARFEAGAPEEAEE